MSTPIKFINSPKPKLPNQFQVKYWKDIKIGDTVAVFWESSEASVKAHISILNKCNYDSELNWQIKDTKDNFSPFTVCILYLNTPEINEWGEISY